MLITINDLPLGEGFGINTNLLETNVLNLAVVIGVLFVFGGDVLTSILKNRQELIVKSLNDAEERFQEATAKLETAKAQLEVAKAKAEGNVRVMNLEQIYSPDVKGKVALVTGASRGIGKTISTMLAANGIKVIGVATSEESLKSIQNINNIIPFCCDISNEKSVEQLYNFSKELFS